MKKYLLALFFMLVSMIFILYHPTGRVLAKSDDHKATEGKTQQASEAAKAKKKEKISYLYVCMDVDNPCISEDERGCKGCAYQVMKHEKSLHTYMEMLGNVIGDIRNDLREYELAAVKNKASFIKETSNRIVLFTPHKGSEDLTKYKEFAEKLGEAANMLKDAAEKEDIGGINRYNTELSITCKGCHELYRK